MRETTAMAIANTIADGGTSRGRRRRRQFKFFDGSSADRRRKNSVIVRTKSKVDYRRQRTRGNERFGRADKQWAAETGSEFAVFGEFPFSQVASSEGKFVFVSPTSLSPSTTDDNGQVRT